VAAVTRVPDGILARLRAIPTSTLCDGYVKAGIRLPERVVITGVRLVQAQNLATLRVAGRARTQRRVLVRTPAPLGQAANPRLFHGFVEDAVAGDFLVIAAPPGPPGAVFGGKLAQIAKLRGVTGVVVDGATRDVAEIIQHDLPVWAQAVTPLAGGYARYSIVENNVPVNCGGIEVIPGDAIVADADGVVVIPPGDIERLLPVCEQIQASEDDSARALAAGKSVQETFAARTYVWDKERSDPKPGKAKKPVNRPRK
jgi:regulator of RNase E activity RraA